MCSGSRPVRGLLLGLRKIVACAPPNPGVRRPDLDPAVLPVEFHVAKDPAPEPREQFGVGAVQDQFADSA